MKKKLFFALALVLGCTHRVHATGFSFRPSLALMGSYTVTQEYTDVRASIFETSNRKFNFGAALTNKCYLSDSWFLRTGIRYNQYQTSVNDTKEYLGRLAPLEWKEEHDVFAIPLLFGKDFITRTGNEGSLFAGFSIGAAVTSEGRRKQSGSSPQRNNMVLTGRHESSFVVTFYPTADLGLDYHPFRELRRLAVGILCSVQPVKTKPFTSEGLVQNLATGGSHTYSIRNRERFIVNGAFTLSYTFGRIKSGAPRGTNPFKCPE